MAQTTETPKLETTSGEPVEQVLAEHQNAPVGQHRSYVVLAADERAKGFVRPYRDRYMHRICGGGTTIGGALSETYARDQSFDTHTFCVSFNTHLPVAEFVWK